MITQLGDAFTTWKNNVESVMASAGATVTPDGIVDFKGDVNKELEEIKLSFEDINSELSKIANTDAFSKLLEQVSKNEEAYKTNIQSYIGKNAELIGSLDDIINKYAEIDKLANGEDDTDKGGGGVEGGTIPTTKPTKPTTEPTDPVANQYKLMYTDAYGNLKNYGNTGYATKEDAAKALAELVS
jgi:hypothetical protein